MSLADLPAVMDPPACTAAQMAGVDAAASRALGIPLEALMENAARQVAAAARVLLGGVAGRRVVALCGPGNNGGDALGALRHLAGWGADVTALVVTPRDRLRPLAGLQHDVLVRLGARVADTSAMGSAAVAAIVRPADLVLDGLLGYSTRGAPRGEIARLIEIAGAGPAPLVAVDLPSGLDPDTGATTGAAIRAATTVTLALPKRGLMSDAAHTYVGQLLLADIGIPAKAYEALGLDVRDLFARGDLRRIVRS